MTTIPGAVCSRIHESPLAIFDGDEVMVFATYYFGSNGPNQTYLMHTVHDGLSWSVINPTMDPLPESALVNVLAFKKPKQNSVLRLPASEQTERGPLSFPGSWSWLRGSLDGITSAVSETSMTVTYRNMRNDPATLYWIDFNGSPVKYNLTEPGQSYAQRKFAGHFWLMEGRDRFIFLAGEAPEQELWYQFIKQ